MADAPLQVVCVDDNEWIGESIRRVLQRQDGFEWGGWFATCKSFMATAPNEGSTLVVLDLDIPGEDAFESVAAITGQRPGARVLILSGYLGSDLVDRALDAGAWGYISKNEAAATVLEAIGRVAAGEVALSPAVVEEYQRQ